MYFKNTYLEKIKVFVMSKVYITLFICPLILFDKFYLIYHLGHEYALRSCWIGLLSTYIRRYQSFSLVRYRASSPRPHSIWKKNLITVLYNVIRSCDIILIFISQILIKNKNILTWINMKYIIQVCNCNCNVYNF